MNKSVTFSLTAAISCILLWAVTTSFIFVKKANHSCEAIHENDFLIHQPSDYSNLFSKIKATKGLKTIVIDAGHGGKDHGCKGGKSKEKTITLKIALKLGKYIKKAYPAINVVYTRKKDVFVPLHNRAKLANKKKADLFISIHCNSVPTLTKRTKRVQGTETYVMGLHKEKENLDVAKRENEAILLEKDYKKNYAGFDPNSPEGHIMLSMYQHAYLDQSINFASKIERQFVKKGKRRSRGVKQAGFVVLRETAMPSVLIEAGFLSHVSEEKFLRTSYGQDIIASGIFRAFKEYQQELGAAPMSMNVAKGEKLLSIANPPKFIKGVVFKVQLGASPKLHNLKKAPWNKVKGIEIQKIKKIHKYLVGEYKSYSDGAKAQRHWQKNGFKDAFIVAYKDGKRISVQEAKKK